MSTENKIGISNGDRAHVLVQAMPYIKKWAGETIVVKYGGNAMINPELKEAVMNDIVLMQLVGINVVLVHGGGPEISAMLKKIGKESRFVNGMRYTDGETMDIVQQVLAGKVNKDLVQLLENTGGKAIGLCGQDGSLLKADKLPAADRLDAAVDLRDHAAADDALALELRHVADVHDRDQRVFVVPVAQQADDVGHQNQLARAELRRDARRRDVGVDVVHLAVVARRDRRDDRDVPGGERIADDLRVHLADLADKAEVLRRGQLVGL